MTKSIPIGPISNVIDIGIGIASCIDIDSEVDGDHYVDIVDGGIDKSS